MENVSPVKINKQEQNKYVEAIKLHTISFTFFTYIVILLEPFMYFSLLLKPGSKFLTFTYYKLHTNR